MIDQYDLYGRYDLYDLYVLYDLDDRHDLYDPDRDLSPSCAIFASNVPKEVHFNLLGTQR